MDNPTDDSDSEVSDLDALQADCPHCSCVPDWPCCYCGHTESNPDSEEEQWDTPQTPRS